MLLCRDQEGKENRCLMGKLIFKEERERDPNNEYKSQNSSLK